VSVTDGTLDAENGGANTAIAPAADSTTYSFPDRSTAIWSGSVAAKLNAGVLLALTGNVNTTIALPDVFETNICEPVSATSAGVAPAGIGTTADEAVYGAANTSTPGAPASAM